MQPSDTAARRAAFRKLHESGCFLIPNPWDRGSALYLQRLGFPALATSSAGFAFTRGLPDSGVTLEAALEHAAEIASAVTIPVTCDFQNGYAHDAEGVARNVALCAATGVAGLSIEDSTGDRAHPLYELPLAVERIAAAREALAGTDALLTARAECFLTGHAEPLKESIRRLQAYAAAGADVLYAPGPKSREELRAIVEAVHPKPVNILMGWSAGLNAADLAALGARRISVGSALARVAWTHFMAAAEAMAAEGSFKGFEGSRPFAEVDALFR